MRLITVQKFPNREIRVTLCQQPPAKPFSFETQDETETIDDAPRPRFLSFAQNSKLPTESKQSGILESQPKTGYGGLQRSNLKFSSYARRMILRAGGALESSHPHSECLFLTLTLPGSTREAFEALARYSAFAVQRFKAWLGKRIKNNLSLYTWELQKRGALHLHYVVHCPSREDGEYILRNLRAQWIRILDAIAERSGTDVYARHRGFSWKTNKEVVRTDGQWCRKSVAAYLSKYVSKEIGKQDGRHRAFCPSRWHGISRPLLQLLREMSYAVRLDYLRSHQALSLYEDCLSLLKSFSIKCYEYKHKVGTGKTLVSYATSEDTNALWEEIVNTLVPEHNSCSNTEQNMRRIIRNGCILIRKHRIWLDTFMQFNGQFYGAKLLNAHYFKDISRLDLIYLADALAYAFRHVQRTRCSLPGECKLWYSQLRTCVDEASQEDKEWIGHLKL